MEWLQEFGLQKKKLVFYHMLPLMMHLTVLSSSQATFIAKEFRKAMQPSAFPHTAPGQVAVPLI